MLLVEVHPDPPRALSDGPQSLDFGEFGALMDELRRLQFVRNGKSDSHAKADSHAGTPAHAKAADTNGRTAPAQASAGDGRLAPLRARIDDLDARIGSLLQERAEVALEVHETRGLDRHGHDPARERELLERAATGSSGPLGPEELTAIWGAILRASRTAQRRRSEEHVLGTRPKEPILGERRP
jgi:chorismate mutase